MGSGERSPLLATVTTVMAAVAVSLAAMLAGAGVASAAEPAAGAAVRGAVQAVGQGRAMVRVAHFAPDVSYVDIYVVSLNGTQLVPNVFYREVSGYWGVPSGKFTYEVRPAGSPRSGAPMVTLRGQLDAGAAYTVATVGRQGGLTGLLLADDMRAAAPGTARARVVNAAVGLPPVDVDLSGTKVRFQKLGFSRQTAYRQVPAGRYRVAVRQPGAAEAVVSRALTVKPGTVSSVVLVGGAGKPRELLPLTDAVGTARMPAGGIATGAGGTARESAPGQPLPVAGAAWLLAVPLAAAAAMRLARLARRSGRRAGHAGGWGRAG
jgi:hypothetical protein